MIIVNPTPEQWNQLNANCFANVGDMEHLNQFPYNNMRPDRVMLLQYLRRQGTYLIEEHAQIVGFICYGNFIPHQPNALGIGIGRQFAGQGIGARAVRELIDRRHELGIHEINGYCTKNNRAAIRLMEANGLVHVSDFQDRDDPNAVKYRLPSGSANSTRNVLGDRNRMMPELPSQEMPAWLRDAGNPLGALPLQEVLRESVYYPACRFDGRPIKYLAGNFHSFVYVDYGVTKADLIREIGGFKGYHVFAHRNVTQAELIPNGWCPKWPSPRDGTPVGPRADTPPFGIWAILERNAQFGDDHGPVRFSILYIGGDGVASFQALYHSNRTYPAVVTIIRPGTGFGGNWTDFRNPELIFARSVQENPAGIPEYLLTDLDRPDWPNYSTLVATLGNMQNSRLCLWMRP